MDIYDFCHVNKAFWTPKIKIWAEKSEIENIIKINKVSQINEIKEGSLRKLNKQKDKSLDRVMRRRH